MLRLRPLAATALAFAVGCSDPASPAPPSSVLGCYQIALGPWSGAHETADPPSVVILTDSVGSYLLEAGRRLLRPWPDPAAMPFDMAWWERRSEGRLELVFSMGGYVGVRMRLDWLGQDWVGRAEAFTDVSPPVQATASATLSPLPCN